MPLHNVWKKMTAGALVFALAAGSAAAVPVAGDRVYAATAAATTSFLDMPAGHWAEKHVTRLFLQGIVTGYVNEQDMTATFRPTRSVTQEEAVLFALRFAGLDKLADLHTTYVFDQDFAVSSWAKAYVDLAFSHELLDRDEEYRLSAADPDNDWGTKPASREWITKLLIRTIGETGLAEELQYTQSRFADRDSIDSRYNGFVNAAVQLGLVKGVDEQRFDPKGDLNRAAMVTLLSRAQYNFPVSNPDIVSGVVTDLTDGAITLYSDGKEQTYSIDERTLYYHYTTEKTETKDRVFEYGDAALFVKNGTAQYVEVLGDVQHLATLTGTFDRYLPEEKKFYIWIDKAPVPITYSERLEIVDTTGRELAIGELKRDTLITLVHDSFRESPVVLKIIASAAPQTTTESGVYKAALDNVITLEQDNKTLLSRYLAQGVTVDIKGLPNSDLSDLLAGDLLELTLNNAGEVVQIKVTDRQVETIAASIDYYNESRNTITLIDAEDKDRLLYITDKTKFEFGGVTMDKASAMKLSEQNVNVLVSYTDQNIVTIKFIVEHSGAITAIDTKNKMVSLKTDAGIDVRLPYVQTFVEDFTMPSATHLNLKVGDVLTVGLRPDKPEAVVLRLHRKSTVEVVKADVAKKTVTVKTLLAETYDISLSQAEVRKEDGTTLAISQLRAGTLIDVHYVGRTAVKVQSTSTASNG